MIIHYLTMSTSKKLTKKGTQLKIICKKGPHDPLLSSLVTKEQEKRYKIIKSRPIYSLQIFDWECVRKLRYEDEIREFLYPILLLVE